MLIKKHKKLLKKEFPDKVKAILPKHVSLANVEIWFEDESRIGQQGSLTRIWAKKGTRPRVVRQQQFMYQYIYGACCPAYNKAAAVILPSANTASMQECLLEISEHVAPGKHAILVLDCAPWHITEKLKVPANITLLSLPPYAPELNPQEGVWRVLKDRYLNNRVFDSMEEITEASCQAWNSLIQTPNLIQSLCHRSWATL